MSESLRNLREKLMRTEKAKKMYQEIGIWSEYIPQMEKEIQELKTECLKKMQG